jgi:outer membrane lipoprotein-sorting protein
MPSRLVHRVVLSGALLSLPGRAPAQTADQVLARYLQARGGIDRIHAVQTLRLTGRMTLPDVEAPLVLELKRPNRMRTEFVFQGRTGVRVYDGQKAWMILPVPGLDQAQAMSPEEARDAREQADIDLSPLVDPEVKGYAVDLLGREAGLGGRETWKIRVRAREGQARTMYLDARTCLVVRIEESRTLEGKEEEFVTTVGDYRSVAGLVFPYAIEVGPKKGGEPQKFRFDKIEVNVPLDDSRFVMPEPARR